MPDVSVIIPTKDRLPYLDNAIQTFLAQEEVREIIFIIDGCQDGTLDYLKKINSVDNRIRYADNVTNQGVTYSRNRGIELATCEYAFTAEDDLTLSDGFMATLFAHMKETGADIISARNVFRRERETQQDAIARTDMITGSTINRGLITVEVNMDVHADQAQPLLPSPMLGKTETFRKIGWDENYRGCSYREESDFQLEALKQGYKLVYCPHTISFNLVIDNDTSGVHALVGFKRLRSIVHNNWYFTQKHRTVIAREFGIKNPYIYIARFIAWRTSLEVIIPFTIKTGRKILYPFRKK